MKRGRIEHDRIACHCDQPTLLVVGYEGTARVGGELRCEDCGTQLWPLSGPCCTADDPLGDEVCRRLGEMK